MRNVVSSLNKAAALATAAVLSIGLSVSGASALPIGPEAGSAVGAPASPLLLQVDVGQHFKYPGSDTAEGRAARAHRNAPHYLCDKQPEKCD